MSDDQRRPFNNRQYTRFRLSINLGICRVASSPMTSMSIRTVVRFGFMEAEIRLLLKPKKQSEGTLNHVS